MDGRLLAIDTATSACSVALFENGTLIANAFEDIGRGHAEKLVPMIATMPDKGKASHIVVNCGPGSFTGVRIGISAAKALALAWNARVQGYQCLHLIASQALDQTEETKGVYVAINGGHGECFVQNFSTEKLPLDDLQSLEPEAALKNAQFTEFAGSAAESLTDQSNANCRVQHILPDAAFVLDLPEQSMLSNIQPIYGRPPDAIAKVGA